MEDRFIRNIGPLTQREQETLHRSKVFIAGCGGIGGYVLEYLARCGVGHIVCVDSDHFEESNLNRQLLAVKDTIGEQKAACAGSRACAIWPDIDVEYRTVALNETNLPALITGCDFVMDALDNAAGRLALQSACEHAGIPLAHGAVSGFRAQAAIVLPGARLFDKIYTQTTASTSGVLSFVVGTAAAMQCSLAVRYLCGHDELHGLHVFDFETMRYEQFAF